MLFRTLDQALGSTAKVRILRTLLPLSSPMSGHEVRMLAGVRSQGGMLLALRELTELGILEREDTRRIRLYRINRTHDLVEPLAALFAAEARRLAVLRQALEEVLQGGAVQDDVVSIIVFGSNARGDARPASDVDLLVVTHAERMVERVQDVLLAASPDIRSRFGLRISPYVLWKDRVQERHRDGDPLLRNVAAEGRTLYGTHFHEVADAW